MPPRKNNHNHRGGGRGRGRGQGQGQGNSHRGVPTTASPAGPSPHPRHRYPHANAEIDVDIQQWSDLSTPSGTHGGGNVNRGNRPWKGGTPASRSGAGTPARGTDSPRRGGSTPRGPGRGKGKGRGRGQGGANDPTYPPRRPRFGIGGGSKVKTIFGKDAPLSNLLYSERPLLRPVKFVRATFTPFLFQQSEDMLKSATEVVDTADASHVPTADRVAELFRGSAVETVSDSSSDSEDDALGALEEIDFADLAQIRAEVDAIAQGTAAAMSVPYSPGEEHIEEVDFADLAAIRAEVDAAGPQSTPQHVTIEETFTGVYSQIKQAAQTSSITGPLEEDKHHDLHEATSSSVSTFDNLKPSTEISRPYNHDLGAVLVKEKSSNPLPIEAPSVSPESHPVAIPTNDTPPYPEAPSPADSHPLFVVDTTPTRPVSGRSASEVILVDRIGHGDMLGDQEEERIVYVAPHPRSGRASPTPPIPRVKLPKTTSMLTGRAPEVGGLRSLVREDDVPDREGVRAEEPSLSLASLTLEPAASESAPARSARTNVTPAMRVRKKETRRQRQRERQHKHHQLRFGAYGAMLSEARLREERQHPRWEIRRQGDSDVDWGTPDEDEDEDEGEGEENDGRDRAEDHEADAASDGHGMEIDPDLVMDLDAMQSFVKSMSVEGSQYVTMDDLEDEARLAHEDEEGYSGPDESSASEDEEEEEAFQLEEEILIAESDGEALSEASGDDLSPTSSFKARLHRIRERSRSVGLKSQEQSDGEKEEDAPEVIVSQGDSEAHLDDLEFTTPVSKKQKDKKKDKGKQTGHFAPELEAQWAKDRAKKAEYKDARARAHLIAALDPLGDSGSGPKHTSRKAMRAAARLDPAAALALTPHALTAMRGTDADMEAIEALMRRFVAQGRPSVALPPMPKAVRKGVHEMAAAFGVGSQSKGKGKGRYTMLFRNGRTGVAVKEGKVRALVKGGGGRGGGGGGRGGKGGAMPRHKDGDEVGKGAPKIGEGNVGFRMLASMGWSEGDKIGGSGSVGIEAPLTATIKNSRLGLGATR